MRGVWKTKVAIPFLASAVLESGALLYSKADRAMQAHQAADSRRRATGRGAGVLFSDALELDDGANNGKIN